MRRGLFCTLIGIIGAFAYIGNLKSVAFFAVVTVIGILYTIFCYRREMKEAEEEDRLREEEEKKDA